MSVKKQANGKWRSYIRYKDAFGKVRQKKKTTFLTKREALRWERDFLAAHAGKATPGLTVNILADKYFDDMSARWKPLSLRSIRNNYHNHIAPLVGDMLVDDITVWTIRQMQTALLNSDRIGVRTAREINTLLSQIFRFGQRMYGLKTNPVALSPLGKRPEPYKYVIWTKEQFDAFYSRLPGKTARQQLLKLYLLLLFYGGFRRGEVLGLQIRDLDFTKNTITIARTRCNNVVGAPKTASSNRTVTMPARIMAKVKVYVDSIYGARPDTLLFPFSASCIGYRWQQYQKLYGKDLPHLRLHDLRHSHASLLIHLGFDPYVVAQRLGHKDAAMVLKIYGHMYDSQRQKVADKLNDLLTNNN